MLNERDPRHPRAGEAEIHVEAIFARLARRGHAVTWLCWSFAGSDAREARGAPLERLGPLHAYYPWVVLDVGACQLDGSQRYDRDRSADEIEAALRDAVERGR